MKFSIVDKVLSACKDYHLPVCILVFFTGGFLQWFHRLDASFVAFTGVVLGAVTGHAFSPAQNQPDSYSQNVQGK